MREMNKGGLECIGIHLWNDPNCLDGICIHYKVIDQIGLFVCIELK